MVQTSVEPDLSLHEQFDALDSEQRNLFLLLQNIDSFLANVWSKAIPVPYSFLRVQIEKKVDHFLDTE